MGDIRGSLYDLFGYFLPGFLGGVGLWLLVWSLAWASATLNIAPIGNPVVAVFGLSLVYIFGHVIQAIGNSLHKLDGLDLKLALTNRGNASKNSVFSDAVLAAIDETLNAKYSHAFTEFSAEERFALIDESRVLASRDGDREVYIYHHGFYRGLLLATGLLALGLVSRLFFTKSCLIIGPLEYCTGRFELLLFLFAATGSALAFQARLKRFARYRIVRAVMLWLVIERHAKKPADE